MESVAVRMLSSCLASARLCCCCWASLLRRHGVSSAWLNTSHTNRTHRRRHLSTDRPAAATSPPSSSSSPPASSIASHLSSSPSSSFPPSPPHTLHLLRLHTPILSQLRLEEALLRTSPHSYLLLNSSPSPRPPPTIVLGISGRPELWLHIPRVRADRVLTLQRFTGGGTVYCDASTLFITFILARFSFPPHPPNPPPPPPYPSSLLSYISSLYSPLFQPHFSLRANDFCLDTRKFAGNAQAITRSHLLHHSSLLWEVDGVGVGGEGGGEGECGGYGEVPEDAAGGEAAGV